MDLGRHPDISLKGGPHGIPPEVVAEVQRGRVLTAAIEVVGGDGFQAATVSSILARARVSRRTFYELFQDREDCFLQAYDAATEQLLRAVVSGCEEEPRDRRLEGGLRTILEHLAARPDVARACVVEVLAAGPVAARRRAAVMARLAHMVARQANATGARAERESLRAKALIGGLHELVHERLVDGELGEPGELLERVTSAGLLPPSDEGAGPRD